MADEIDQAQENYDSYLESLIEKERFRASSSESLYYCRLCGERIQEERRKILPGVQICFYCQSENERRQR
ncbi:TraR/DksA C4-type zinc finger protein [Salmonella enterica]|uniref:TraR/DksA family transcriptional regulator n=4 Tax=Salmonella enterica TaxID=28901 RepID=A0A765C0I0_SALER|nr:TraR/DksA C4-type zinc finger protein [Salmonella enterica]EBR7997310.1 TraR/DksA family transcriptional regulator [Salmonella enterica subsp. enterica serovar Panama]EBS4088866.1 TraR/DksA family transcriptional regulator [Salmonella enterica subsp. enterica serovar Newport]EBW8396268.1 TraR/DksA family transcriptional regulator [Salmonella enterica subsp. enterica serovar Florida]ECC9938159.1 TraR/DksA family transcriptional regulator [Salmonella enterica subsp. enterica]ECE5796307.1 conj